MIRDSLKSRWTGRALLRFRRLSRALHSGTVHTPIGEFVQDRLPNQAVGIASHALVLVLGFLLVAPFLTSTGLKAQPVIANARSIPNVQLGNPAHSAAVAQEIRESVPEATS